MPAAGRLGDKAHAPADSHGCPACAHPVSGPAVSGSTDVLINGKPALRVGDSGVHSACCGPNTWTAVGGAGTVLINGRMAHRLGDATQHCGGAGHLVEGSPDVIIGDSPWTGPSTASNCTQLPPPLTDQQMLAEAEAFLTSQGYTFSGTEAERLSDIRQIFQKNPDLRRDLLKAQGEAERNAGRLGLEIFSNAVQRSRWLNTSAQGEQKRIDGAEVGRDIGLLFAGTDSIWDGPVSALRNDRWNLNDSKALPPSGFRQDRLNDDGSKSHDQTHHVAYYMMVGATNDSVLGEGVGNLGGTLSDIGHPNDQALAYDGVDLGRRIDDPNLDVHAWIWNTLGDPCQTQPGNPGSNSGSSSNGSDSSSDSSSDNSSGW